MASAGACSTFTSIDGDNVNFDIKRDDQPE
jgi:hypothetical protein